MFDAVIGNPPYNGKAALHQQFFNKAVDVVTDGGVVCFIQPATPYFNRKSNRKSAPEVLMIENVRRFKTSVAFYDHRVFENAAIATGLAVTILKKNADEKLLRTVTYPDGSTYANVETDNINMLGINPIVYKPIREKYQDFIATNGALHDLVSKIPLGGAYIQGVRGHPDTPDFHTLVSNNKAYHKIAPGGVGMSVDIPEAQFGYFYTYAQTFVARMGLAISKFNMNNHAGELKTVPLVPFDRHWTDEELAKLIGLTDEELDVIRTVLPDYHDLL